MPGSHPRSFLSDSLGADPDICFFSQTTVMCSLGCEFRMHKETESNSGATRTRRSVPLLSFPQRRGPTAAVGSRLPPTHISEPPSVLSRPFLSLPREDLRCQSPPSHPERRVEGGGPMLPTDHRQPCFLQMLNKMSSLPDVPFSEVSLFHTALPGPGRLSC